MSKAAKMPKWGKAAACLRLVACIAAGIAVVCEAASTTWNGGDGNWDDPAKWSNGVPSGDTPGEVKFKTTGEPYTVTLNHPVTNEHFIVLSPASGVATAPVTLAGYGTVTNIGVTGVDYAFETQARTSFILDGPTFRTRGATNIRGDMEIKSGNYTQDGTLFPTTSNSTIKVSGGYFSVPRLKLIEKGGVSYVQTGGSAYIVTLATSPTNTALVTGGYAWIPNIEANGSDKPLTVTGGILRRYTTLNVPVGSLDWRNVTNVVNTLNFKGGKIESEISRYCGPCVVIGKQIQGDNWQCFVGYPLGISLCSSANWSLVTAMKMRVRERMYIDTADFFDRTIHRSVDMTSSKGLESAPFDFAVYGGGTFTFALNDSGIMPGAIDAFTLGEGTTMTMIRPENNYHRKNNLIAQRLKLGAGSDFSLMLRHTYLDSSDTAEIGDGATINAAIYTAATDTELNYGEKRYPIIIAGPTGSVENVTVNLIGDGTSGWAVRKLLNSAWADDGTTVMTPDTTLAREWCGGTDGYLSTAANWSSGNAPDLTAGYNGLEFKTMQGMVTNDVDNFSVSFIGIHANCGPIRMRGKPVKANNVHSHSSASAIVNVGKFPLVFENDVIGPQTCNNFCVVVGNSTYNSSTYVAFMGRLTVASPVFDVCGHVIVGGEATANSIFMDSVYSSGRRTRLEILSGGSMTVSSQSNAFNKSGDTSFRVNGGGLLSFTGGTFDNRVVSNHRVFGLMDIDVPLLSTTNLSFAGSGRVYVASTKSSATASKVKLSEGIRFCPKSWATLTADGVAPITIYAETRAIIGAKADWTYGPAAGVTTATTPAERAIVTEDFYAPLTIDTTDPDTGVGHTITFADPILAVSDVEVKGAGAVCFASGEDSFGHKLSFDGNVTLLLNAAQRNAALDGWAAILTAEEIAGMPKVADGVKVRIVDNGDNTQSLLCRVPPGLRFIVR